MILVQYKDDQLKTMILLNKIWIWCEKWLRRHENVSQRLDSKCVDSFLLIKESVQFI